MNFKLKDDPRMAELIEKESLRQKNCLDLIASQSLAPEAIKEICGSDLANRTIEGYPGKRYYAGGEFLDDIEKLTIDRAKNLFNAEHANVQPHCGTNTNLAVFQSILDPGDTILSMDMSSGGHLSHGHRLNIASRIYKFIHYGVKKDTELIDYDQMRQMALKYRPKLIIGGGSSYPREVRWDKMKQIADETGAKLLADVAHTAGLIATGMHTNPVKFCDFVTFSLYKTMPGPRGGCILCKEKYRKAIDQAIFPGHQGSMLTPYMAAKGTAFLIAGTKDFQAISRKTVENAKILSDELRERGYRPVTGGTDCHLILIDLRNKGLTGKEAEKLLEDSRIIVNRNGVPFDPLKPWIASGIRLGTTVATMRGMGKEEMKKIGILIDDVLSGKNKGDEVCELCNSHYSPMI